MKILFLQNMSNAIGGITNVNISLMEHFNSQGDEITLISIRKDTFEVQFDYPAFVQELLINDKELWGCPRLYHIVENLKKLKIITASRQMFNRVKYKLTIKKDYKRTKEKIDEINPDIVICSHYECLDSIPEKYLNKTIMHFHTSFDQIVKNKSYSEIFNKYRDKLGKFVWLSKSTCNQAIESGYTNSIYIYNPVRFSVENLQKDYDSKRVVFIGRLSKEKRVDLAINMFAKVTANDQLKDWVFDIYGAGVENQKIIDLASKYENVIYHGQTSEIPMALKDATLFILTSEFEGLPLVVLEANECGVPVVSFNFGETINEVIADGNTGIIVEQDNQELFVQQLESLMLSKEKREEYGKNAKIFASQFNIQQIGKEWYELFSNITNGK